MGPSNSSRAEFSTFQSSKIPRAPVRHHYHATGMTNEVTINTGKAATTAPAEDRRYIADLLTLVLGHLCVKMFWRALYATNPQVNTEREHFAFIFAAVVLFIIDAVVQVSFVDDIRKVAKSLDPEHRHNRCGIAFVIAYTLWFLPSATTMIEIFQIGTWVTLVFNVGCLVELRLGLFGKGVDALVDSWQVER